MIDSLTRPRIKRFRLASDIRITGSKVVMSSYLLVCIVNREARRADTRLAAYLFMALVVSACVYFSKYRRSRPVVGSGADLYRRGFARNFRNVRYLEKSSVYYARYVRLDRYMRSSESEGLERPEKDSTRTSR